MRYKVVPEARSVAFLRDVQAALPLVPGTVEDCCSRIRDRTGLPSRDVAREYLTFAQALGLAAEGDRGFHRTREDPSEDDLADRFLEHVFGAREVVDALDEGSKTVAETFEAMRDVVPRWERDRHTDWEAEWLDRTERLLEWAVEFGLVERSEDGYRRVTDES
ncbi:hypothetical protein SAMN05216559_1376 [Halomicrobium zhouii]|uniref:Uncharacterized protein n=1 Tax=Halomicrobium zhouii TaxID=767519 RepID=A0A1I6KRI2_9EURY|nr:hypothetical protein [Halomicrobium zhouii]SFR93797.1 hypothetical protein SAMN05216559_1376 [Halomicrobium zhouii]